MRILYLSCHAVLEFDELRLFGELGYDYFSIGSYLNPTAPLSPMRPPLDGEHHQELAAGVRGDPFSWAPQADLHPDHIEWADVIIAMHMPQWIESNWEKMRHKRVVWRTIGQSVPEIEERMSPFRDQGLEIVRCSPREATIPGYIGSSATIRFSKDPEEFGGWTGRSGEVITFNQAMRGRAMFCNFDAFARDVRRLDAHVYGPGNEDAGRLNGGLLSYDELKQKMRDGGVYYYVGSHPASYTLNFIEAWMTGVPIVAIGPTLGNSTLPGWPGLTYEIPDLIRNGESGFVSDKPRLRRKYIRALLRDGDLARYVSANARKDARALFGKDVVISEWKRYLER